MMADPPKQTISVDANAEASGEVDIGHYLARHLVAVVPWVLIWLLWPRRLPRVISMIHSADVVLPHPGLQGRALESESRGCSISATDVPIGFLKRIQDACAFYRLGNRRSPAV